MYSVVGVSPVGIGVAGSRSGSQIIRIKVGGSAPLDLIWSGSVSVLVMMLFFPPSSVGQILRFARQRMLAETE